MRKPTSSETKIGPARGREDKAALEADQRESISKAIEMLKDHQGAFSLVMFSEDNKSVGIVLGSILNVPGKPDTDEIRLALMIDTITLCSNTSEALGQHALYTLHENRDICEGMEIKVEELIKNAPVIDNDPTGGRGI